MIVEIIVILYGGRKMKEENTLLVRLAGRLFSCPAQVIRDKKKDGDAFEKKYCFRPQLQPFFTENGLSTLLTAAKDNVFYVLSDKLHLAIVFFRFKKSTYVIGPFALEPLTAASIEKDTEGIPLSLSQRRLLYIYCSSFPVLDSSLVTKSLQCILMALSEDTPVFSIRKLNGFYEDIHSTGDILEEEKDDRQIALIRKKYEVENRMLSYIRHGETEKALSSFRQIAKDYNADSAQPILAIYQDPRVSMSILRALWRKAAEEGGLSVVTIDELTQFQAQQSMKAGSIAEQLRTMDRLLRDLCEAVRKTREETEGCSAETKAVLEYIYLHISDEIRMEDLTDMTGYSRSHISAAFKEDTGRTISSYIAQKRCEKAGELLSSTSLSVQDIALRVGYPDNNYFIKVFKKQFGMTPTDFRKKKEISSD